MEDSIVDDHLIGIGSRDKDVTNKKKLSMRVQCP